MNNHTDLFILGITMVVFSLSIQYTVMMTIYKKSIFDEAQNGGIYEFIIVWFDKAHSVIFVKRIEIQHQVLIHCTISINGN